MLAHIALPAMVAVTLAVVGAFGSYVSMALPLRLLHFVSVGIVIGSLSFALAAVLRRFCFGGKLPFWAMLAIAIVTTPPGGWLVLWLLTLWAPATLPYVSYRELTAQVLVLNILIGSIAWILRRRPETRTAMRDDAPQRPPSDQALRARLPVQCRHAAILALSAEDHYVRVRTERGDALILMNLAAAIAALGEGAGVRIHRSHWVSHRIAATAMARKGRNDIRIDDTTALPVSRAGRKLLRDTLAG